MHGGAFAGCCCVVRCCSTALYYTHTRNDVAPPAQVHPARGLVRHGGECPRPATEKAPALRCRCRVAEIAFERHMSVRLPCARGALPPPCTWKRPKPGLSPAVFSADRAVVRRHRRRHGAVRLRVRPQPDELPGHYVRCPSQSLSEFHTFIPRRTAPTSAAPGARRSRRALARPSH